MNGGSLVPESHIAPEKFDHVSDALLILTVVPSLVTIFGNLVGGLWAGSGVMLLALMAFGDWTLGESADFQPKASRLVVVLCPLHMFLYGCGIGTLLYSCAIGRLHGFPLILAILSTSIHSTSVGGNSAHELIHKSRWERCLGSCALSLVGYSHFAIEHRQGHHARFAQDGDPTTALRDETIYHFFWRTTWQQLFGSIALENRRIALSRRTAHLGVNWVLYGKVGEGLLLLFITLIGGPIVMLVFLIHAVLTIFLMQIPNYVGHYGILRVNGDDSDMFHSWETDHRVSGLMLLNVGRHADHHSHPARRFPELRSRRSRFRLPSGLYGLLPFILVPALWRKLIHPRLDAVDMK